MKHVRVAVYDVKPGTIDEAIRRGEAGLLPIFRSQPGFVSYGLIKTSEDSGISLSIWETREQAEASSQTAASWAKENLAGLVVAVQTHIGDLIVFSTVEPISV